MSLKGLLILRGYNYICNSLSSAMVWTNLLPCLKLLGVAHFPVIPYKFLDSRIRGRQMRVQTFVELVSLTETTEDPISGAPHDRRPGSSKGRTLRDECIPTWVHVPRLLSLCLSSFLHLHCSSHAQDPNPALSQTSSDTIFAPWSLLYSVTTEMLWFP